MPMFGYTRWLASRLIMNVNTSVMLVSYASASRSNCRATCSSNVSGTPMGASERERQLWPASPRAESAARSRGRCPGNRSAGLVSRTEPALQILHVVLDRIEDAAVRLHPRQALRAVPARPNIRSNTRAD